MKITIQDKKLNQIKADYELVFVVKKNFKHKWINDEKILKELKFKGSSMETAHLSEKHKLYIGLDNLKHDEIRIGVATAVNVLQKINCKNFKVGSYIEDEDNDNIQAMTEGAVLGAYIFDMYKSKKEKIALKEMIISSENYDKQKLDMKVAKADIKTGNTIAQATNYTRDIVNQIPEEVTPLTMSQIAKDLAKESGLKVKVHGENYLKKEGMGAFLAVSKASPYPPQLIHLIHKPEKPQAKICLVGKGLTYDSGGLSLKPGDSMVTMKSDKSGASAVLGIMKAVSELNIPLEVHGIVGAVENMVGKHAYKPDDVLTAKNGKTIEVKNTDAEGRLVLADCLCYAQELKPDYVIDLATLTGACMVALGEYTSGVMGFSRTLKTAILDSAEKSGELAGDLPFNRYLPKLLKSEVADISNLSASKFGGAITAGLFLSEFIEEKYKDKWIHLDIAGPAFVEKAWGENPYGGSGAGVRLIIAWLKQLIDKA